MTAASQSTAGPQTPAQQLIGNFAPKLVELTDDVLFGDVRARPELRSRDRSLITYRRARPARHAAPRPAGR